MNVAAGELNGLHKTYIKCVDAQMKEYLSNAAVRAEDKETELCAKEEDAYCAFDPNAYLD